MQQGLKVSYKSGEIITKSDDLKALYLVKRGYVKRYQITNSGTISTQNIYGPGDIYPLTYVFEELLDKKIYKGPEEFFYEAMTNVELWQVTLDDIKNYSLSTPELYRGLLIVSADRFLSNIQLLENLSLTSATRRVAHLIWSISITKGKEDGDGRTLNLTLTQQDLGDLLNITRESVSTAYNVLKNLGLVKKKNNRIHIVNTERLKELIYT